MNILARLLRNLIGRAAPGTGTDLVEEVPFESRLARCRELAAAGDAGRALAMLEDLLRGDDRDARVHVTIAYVRRTLGDDSGAARALEAALAFDPALVECHVNLGHLALERQEPAIAASHYDAALSASLSLPGIELARAGALLQSGDYERGFREYECRWRSINVVRRRWIFERPRWDGTSDIAGQRVLVHAEQGFGDAIQFVRYVPDVIGRGASVVVQCQRELVPLFATVSGVEAVISKDDVVPPFDRQIPMGSLPLAFGTTLATVPARVPYLGVDAARVATWEARAAAVRRPRIGIAWASRSNAGDAREKSLALAMLEPLLKACSGHVVSLQTGVAPDGEEARLLGRYGVPDLGAGFADFSDSAALLSVLDRVITVDTALAHLAGALGCRGCVLLQHLPDWRWLLHRDDSPWYPTLRLVRQTVRGDWATPVNGVAAELDALLAEGG